MPRALPEWRAAAAELQAERVPVRPAPPLPSRRATPPDIAAEYPKWRAALREGTPGAAYLRHRLGDRWQQVAEQYDLGEVPNAWAAEWASPAWAAAAQGRVALPLTLPGGTVWSVVLRAISDAPRGPTDLARSRYIAPAGRREQPPWFGVHVAAQAGPREIVVTEGPFDVLAVAAFAPGRLGVAVTAGAAIDQSAVGTLRRWLPSVEAVTIAMDADATGQRYAVDVARLCENAGLAVSIRHPPKGLDLAGALASRAASSGRRSGQVPGAAPSFRRTR